MAELLFAVELIFFLVVAVWGFGYLGAVAVAIAALAVVSARVIARLR